MLQSKITPQTAANDDIVPALAFSSDVFKDDNAFETMSAFSQGLYSYSVNPDAADLKRPYLRLLAWSLGGVSAASFSNSGLLAAATQVAPEFADQVVLRIVRSGQVPVKSGDQTRVMVPGQIYILHPQNTLSPTAPGQSIALRLPMLDIGYDPSRHPRILAYPEHDHIGRVVSSALDVLFEGLPGMTRRDADVAGAIMCALVRGMLSATQLDEQARNGWRTAQDTAMRRYLLDNLRAPDLGITHLQKNFGASRATIYRAFETVGGVASFIRRERLAAIAEELRNCCPSHGCIRRISERYGFVDQSVFAKSFKREMGMRPGDVIGLNVGRLKAPPAPRHATMPLVPNLAHFWSGHHAA